MLGFTFARNDRGIVTIAYLENCPKEISDLESAWLSVFCRCCTDYGVKIVIREHHCFCCRTWVLIECSLISETLVCRNREVKYDLTYATLLANNLTGLQKISETLNSNI